MPEKNTVLIINDSAGDRVVLSDAFSDEFNVIQLTGGKEGVDFLVSAMSHVDVVLLDSDMPVMNGFEVLEQLDLKGITKDIPIVLTLPDNSPNAESVERGYDLDAAYVVQISYISKTTLYSAMKSFSLRKNVLSRIDFIEDTQSVWNDFSKSFAAEYYGIYYLDFSTMEYYTIKEEKAFSGMVPRTGEYLKLFETVVENLIYPDDRARFGEIVSLEGFYKFAAVHDGYKIIEYEFRKLKSPESTEYQWVRIVASIKDDNDADMMFFAFENIDNERKRNYRDLYTDIYTAAISDMYQMIYEVDRETKSIYRLTLDDMGLHKEFIINYENNNFDGFAEKHVHKDDISKYLAAVNEKSLDEIDRNGNIRYEFRRREGVSNIYRWYSFDAFRFDREDGVKYIIFARDINDEKEKLLEHSKTRTVLEDDYSEAPDEITGLVTKKTFFNNVEQRIKDNLDKTHYIIIADIYRFKLINEMFGTDKANELLKSISDFLTKNIFNDCENMIIGKLETDRIAMCLESTRDPDIYECDSRMRKFLRELMPTYEIMVYFGVYKVDEPTTLPQIMCGRATTAMSSIHGNYNKRFAVYDEEMHKALIHEQEISSKMSEAVNKRLLEVYYQPIIDVESNKYVFAEALVRWNYPGLGMLLPADFMDVFEKTGYVTKLDEYVIEQACMDIAEAKKRDYSVMPVSVNISVQSSESTYFVPMVRHLTSEYGIEPDELMFEFKEEIFKSRKEYAVNLLMDLRNLGYKVLMDHFGSGYTAFNTLKDVDINFLKLDLRMLPDCASEEKTSAIVTSLIRMSKMLNLPMIIEGVETKEQTEFLNSIGCLHLQGFYYSKPLSRDDFLNVVVNNENISDMTPGNASLETYDIESLFSLNPELDTAFNSFGIGICTLAVDDDKTAHLIKANKEFYNMFGFDSKDFELVTDIFYQSISEADKNKFLKYCDDIIESKEIKKERLSFKLPDRDIMWVEIRAGFAGIAKHRKIISAVLTDITSSYSKTYDSENALNSIALLNEVSGSLFIEYDTFSDAMKMTRKYDDKEDFNVRIDEYSKRIKQFSSSDDEAIREYSKAFFDAMRIPCRKSFQLNINDPETGDRHWYSLVYISEVSKEGRTPSRIVGRLDCIDDFKKYQHQAELDAVTGLYNYQTFREKASLCIKNMQNENKNYGLLTIELLNIEKADEKFSKSGTDALLCEAARIIIDMVNVVDVIGTAERNRFYVLYTVVSKTLFEGKCNELCLALNQRMNNNKTDIICRAGMAFSKKEDSFEFEKLKAMSETALKKSIDKKSDSVIAYNPVRIVAVPDEKNEVSDSFSKYVFDKIRSAEDEKSAVNEILKYVCEELKLTGATVYEMTAGTGDAIHIIKRSQWRTKDSDSKDYDSPEMPKSFLNCFDENNILYCNSTGHSGTHLGEKLCQLGLKAILEILLTDKNGKPWAILSFEDSNNERMWSLDEINVLKFTARTTGTVLKNNKTSEEVLLG